MNLLLELPIHLLTAAFVMGSAGCVLLVPVVAFKFVSVLFEKDPVDDSRTAEE